MADKRNILISILVFVIIVLLAIVVYVLIVRPAITGYTVNAQNQGYNLGYTTAIFQIIQIASRCQTVPLTAGNQTINLIALECFQVAQQSQQQPQTQQ